MNEYKYKDIKTIYGNETIHRIRSLETVTKSLGRHESHLKFNLQCKHTDIIPNNVKINSKEKNNEARVIIHKAERAILNIRISETITRINKLKITIRKYQETLQKTIAPELYTSIAGSNERRRTQAYNKARDTQKKKYENLKNKNQPTHNPNHRTNPTPTTTTTTTATRPATQPNAGKNEPNNIRRNHILPENGDHRIPHDQQATNNNTYINTSTLDTTNTEEEHNSTRTQNNEELYITIDEIQSTEIQINSTDNTRNTQPQNNQTQEEEKDKSRWVLNLSSTEITENQKKLLEKGAGFAITPKNLPIEDYIISTELAGKYLHPGEAAALKAEVAEILQGTKKPISNLTKEERQALKELKENETIIIVPADKGKCFVIMDKHVYIQKMEEKLKDTTTYKQIDEDPTHKIKEKISTKN